MELYDIVFEEIGLDGSKSGHNPKKFNCPGCSKKRFVRYLHHTTGEYLPDIYGRCDREQGCAYFLSPFEDIKQAKRLQRENSPNYTPPERIYEPPQIKAKERRVCSRELMFATMKEYHKQELYLWFVSKFGYATAKDVFSIYNVGTAKDGSTLFWQVDKNLQVRTCQKIKYQGFNRNKTHPPYRLFKTGEDYEPCLFGEHLLHIARLQKLNPIICITESEKTAMIASIYLPYIETKTGERPTLWMAASGSNGLTDSKISTLQGYDVILVPDFSYRNRAEWGLFPMRKAKREFNVQGRIVERAVPDPNGEIDPLYIPARDRILYTAKATHCNVWDAQPQREDGGDIADHLIEGQPFVIYRKPNFKKYTNALPAFGTMNYETATLQHFTKKNPTFQYLIDTLNCTVEYVLPV